MTNHKHNFKNDEISNTVYGPGTCVDCMDHDVTYECWYGADDAAPEDIERIRRKQKMDLLLGAGAFSKAMKGITTLFCYVCVAI